MDASAEAYAHLHVGDAFIGLLSYSITAGLAAMGGIKRAESAPWLPLALSVKAGADAAQAARLTHAQFARQRAGCMWCLIAATATIAACLLTLPEAKHSLQIGLLRRHRL